MPSNRLDVATVRPYHSKVHTPEEVRRSYAEAGAFTMKTLSPITREAIVTVRGGPSGLAQTVEIRSHKLIADEPIEFGGADSGPTPYELLMAALGT